MSTPAHILTLEALLQAREPESGQLIAAAGCTDAYGARLALHAGFDVVMVGGGALALSRYGRSLPQLLSPEAIIEALYVVRGAVDSPLLADAADGFGNALHVSATVRAFEFAGASAVQISDRPLRRRDRAEGPRFAVAEMIGKLKAALDVRRHCLIVAVIEVDADDSMTAIADRAAAYVETGADMLVLRSDGLPKTLSEFGDGASLYAPVGFEWGRAHDPSDDGQLGQRGYSLSLRPYLFAHLLDESRDRLNAIRATSRKKENQSSSTKNYPTRG